MCMTETVCVCDLSAGLAAPSVASHRTRVLQTRQAAVTRVAAGQHFLCTRQRRLYTHTNTSLTPEPEPNHSRTRCVSLTGLPAGTGPADRSGTWRTRSIVTHVLTGVIPTGQPRSTHLTHKHWIRNPTQVQPRQNRVNWTQETLYMLILASRGRQSSVN